ncbi:MAG: Ig-like domain-containing protein [Bdellovibrionota bacterium]
MHRSSTFLGFKVAALMLVSFALVQCGFESNFLGNNPYIETNHRPGMLEPALTRISLLVPLNSPGNVLKPTFRILGTQKGNTLSLYRDSSCSTLVQSVTSTQSPTDIALTTNLPAEGTYEFYAREVDSSGNQSSCVGPVVYVLDTTAPSLSLNALPSINLGNASAVPFSGTCSEDGQRIVIVVNGSPISYSPALTCSGGSFSGTVNLSGLSDGSLSIAVSISDAAGNSTSTSSQSVTKDATAPSITLDPLTVINSSNVASYAISGTCSENGQNISLLVDTGVHSFSSSVTCSGGIFSGLSNMSSFGNSVNHIISVSISDASGNAAVASRNVYKDSSTPTSGQIQSYTWSMSSPSNGTLSNDVTPVIALSGASAEAGTIVRMYSDNACSVLRGTSKTISAGGNTLHDDINFSNTGLDDGSINFYVTFTDLGSNISPCTSIGLGYVLDTIGPSNADAQSMTWSISSPTNGSTSNDTTPTLSSSGANIILYGSFIQIYDDIMCLNPKGAQRTIFLGSTTHNDISYLSTGADDGTKSFYYMVFDSIGNSSNCFSTTRSYTLDTTKPSVSISSGSASPTNSSPIPITITFSESVTGFTVGDLTVGNGSASGFAGSGTTYTANITPTADGNVTVNIAGGVAQDAAGNTNNAASSFSISYDGTAPTVSISSALSSPTNASPIPVTITFSESVTGFTVGDLTVGNGSASGFAGSGTTYTANITPTANGPVTIDVAGGAAQDAAGNNNTAATQFSIVYDTGVPSVIISSVLSSPTSTSPIPVTITFSEGVTGFTVGDIVVGNGIKSNFAGSGSTYTVDVTPSSDGTVTVDVGTGVAQDAASNNNSAATQFSISYDGSAPTVSISSSLKFSQAHLRFPSPLRSAKVLTGFSIGDLTVSNGSASGFAGSGTTRAKHHTFRRQLQ